MGLALLIILTWSVGTALAADIALDDSCSLRNAIESANQDRSVGGCNSGSGPDTILLSSDITMTEDPPAVSSQITIEGAGHTLSGDDLYRLFFVAAGGDLTLKDLTLTKGLAQEGSPNCVAGRDWSADYGGAICNHGKLGIHNSRISRNAAALGGAIYSYSGASVSISDSAVYANTAVKSGGAMFIEGEARISDSTFSGNKAKHGGALNSSAGARVSISGSIFFGNSADSSGGAISSRTRESLDISDSRFSGNSADFGGAIDNDRQANVIASSFSANSADYGGAIYNSMGGASIRINDSRFSENRGFWGGALANDMGEARILGSEFSDNHAIKGGGALYNRSNSGLSVSDSSFRNNRGWWGGAMINYGEASIYASDFVENFATETGGALQLNGKVALNRVTITHNYAASGGGIRIGYDQDSIGAVTLRDSILADNVADVAVGDCVVHADSALSESVGNYIRDGSCEAQWQGRNGLAVNGYCPAEQLREGICAIGAPAKAATAEASAPILVDERCTLGDAIRAANDDQARGNCSAGSGHDIIRLTDDIVMMEDPPAVTSKVTIEGGGYMISGQERFRLFYVDARGDLAIRQVRLTRGMAHEHSPPCQTGDSSSKGMGGAICNRGRLSLLDSNLDQHIARVGGAIVNFGDAIIERSELSENLADYGAAMTNWGAAVIVSSGFDGNSAAESGGALYNAGGAIISVSDSRFTGNSARWGGSFFNSADAIANISRSRFAGNLAEDTGGAIYIPFGTATISQVTIRDNLAEQSGGIYAGNRDTAGTALRLSRSILVDNAGGDCGLGGSVENIEFIANYIGDGSCGARWFAGWAHADEGYCPDGQMREDVCAIGAPELRFDQVDL